MEKIWLKHYQEGVTENINPDAYSSLVDLFKHRCEKFHDKTALINFDTALTYQEWLEHSRDFAAYLQQALHVQSQDRFAIMLPNVLQHPIAMFGAFLAGMIVTNINPQYTARELGHQLQNSGATVILVLANFADTVQAVLEDPLVKTAVKHVIVTNVGDLFPFPKQQIFNFFIKYIKRAIPRYFLPNHLSFKKMLEEGSRLSFREVAVKPDDIAYLQYTGGTTGISKGAMLTHRNMIANVMQATVWVSPLMREGEEIIITALPLYHIFSLTANCLTFLYYGAQNVLITNPRDMRGFIRELAKYPFTAITGVNTLFNALLNFPSFCRLNFSSLKLALGGGMAIQHAVAKRWQDVTGKPLLEAYGLTEASPAVSINPLNYSYNGSIGLPVPSTDVMILDVEDKPVGINKRGELCVKGPQVMRGYWQNAAETLEVLSEDGWLKTGDIVYMDEQGFLYLVDRKKDVIVVSGFKLYPNEIEDVVAAHPGVLEVAAIGVPDAVTGERLILFVVKKDPALTEKALLDYCRAQLTGYKVPKAIEFRNTLPKSNVGKILRRVLREQFRGHEKG